MNKKKNTEKIIYPNQNLTIYLYNKLVLLRQKLFFLDV